MKILKYRLLNHILFWIFIYVFYSIAPIISSGDFVSAKINLIYLPFDIITVYIIIGFFIPRYLFKQKFLIFLLGAAITISINIIISQYIKYNIHPLFGLLVKKRSLPVDLFYALLSNFMIVGMATAMKLLSHSFKIQISQSEIERRSVKSELGILRSQVNPHFLFNVLNNIDSLIFENKEKASNAIFLLSKIMRYMLQESTVEKVKLDKELTYIEDYLELARLSFEDPDFLDYIVRGSSAGKLVPPLLFIPIIENAIKHCNKKSSSPGILIEFNIENEHITLKSSNFLKNNTFKLPDDGSTGNGLKNVRKRLDLLYGDNFDLTINKTETKFDIYLKVPLS